TDPAAPIATFTEYALPAGATPINVKTGSDGAIWYTDNGDGVLGRMLTSGVLAGQTKLTGVKEPFDLALGADNNFYVSDPTDNVVGQFNPSTGKTVVFTSPSANAQAAFITIGPDSEIYFGEPGVNKIAQLRY